MANLIPAVDLSVSALSSERLRMETVASNLANLQTTRDINGLPYRRKQVVFETLMNDHAAQPLPGFQAGLNAGGVKVTKIMDDPRPFEKKYNPGHPHADATGWVRMPNVNQVDEMIDLMTANRSYEANLQVIKTARDMTIRSIAIAEGR
jgi:flagellar basal-body rod protein FlgC